MVEEARGLRDHEERRTEDKVTADVNGRHDGGWWWKTAATAVDL